MQVTEGSAQLETDTNTGTLNVGSGLRNRACVKGSEILTIKRQAQFILLAAFLFRQVFFSRLRLVVPYKRCFKKHFKRYSSW